ncbi:hypothetical protein FNF07_08975 [Trinickia caryophylli]|nr:hypothetical protein C0Z17_21940 [Trinickia caryophylli]TRX20271.1 hypothetical protein FNF07_08975 [Trinickia caryophylli]
MNSRLSEGALIFLFPDDGLASKYDHWSHYRNGFQAACGGHHKAVDIVYAQADERIAWLIEVKDYRVHARTKAIDLAEEIAVKVRDTLAGLVATGCQANDQNEKDCARALLRAAKIRVVCHLEQPTKHSRLRPRVIEPDKLAIKLRTLIKAIDPRALVVDRHSLHASMTWRVEDAR